ncbi:MAG: hypothetical protein AAFQ75_11230 [Pseudomonadota bacterium]
MTPVFASQSDAASVPCWVATPMIGASKRTCPRWLIPHCGSKNT